MVEFKDGAIRAERERQSGRTAEGEGDMPDAESKGAGLTTNKKGRGRKREPPVTRSRPR